MLFQLQASVTSDLHFFLTDVSAATEQFLDVAVGVEGNSKTVARHGTPSSWSTTTEQLIAYTRGNGSLTRLLIEALRILQSRKVRQLRDPFALLNVMRDKHGDGAFVEAKVKHRLAVEIP